MVLTFNELLLTANPYPLDIVALSETWLRDQPQLFPKALLGNSGTGYV